MKEVSAGGVVFNSKKILLLRKFNGGWVLPKGHVKKGEKYSETALREVKEESGINAKLGQYIDSIEYQYFNFRKMKKSHKTVHWFTMYSTDIEFVPLEEEGFNEARYVETEKAMKFLIHNNEKTIIKKAIELMCEGEQ
ncbi:MAG: NUDIX hydrolase [Tissierellia bacterium]|jgi:8-oxo-dGTP pyrophosphatase MutT (NUDIX family)|nr:NUDIX hydrolase [Tissierellia bacterium]